jgi:hypothetical protein
MHRLAAAVHGWRRRAARGSASGRRCSISRRRAADVPRVGSPMARGSRPISSFSTAIPRRFSTAISGKPPSTPSPTGRVAPQPVGLRLGFRRRTARAWSLPITTSFSAPIRRWNSATSPRGGCPRDATLYICAQDRGGATRPTGPERFEIIMNGPPGHLATDEERQTCRTRTFATLEKMGLTFSPVPDDTHLTTPADFDRAFPASDGSLYGRSPHGMMATFHRPAARTAVPGLYLCGGGTHPGAGIPMACLSGKHAAAAIMSDLASTSTSRRTATRGGMSTASPTMANAPSRSSAS